MDKIVKLSKADRIILTHLETDGKILEKTLAKKCNLSKDGVRYRIRRLQKEGVIKKFSAFVDYGKLGYSSFKLYLKLNGSEKQIKEFKKHLKSHKNLFAIFESTGTSWNLGMAFFCRTPDEYYKLENSLFTDYDDLIINKRFCSMVESWWINNGLLIDNPYHVEYSLLVPGNETLNKIDSIIVRLIHKDSKISLLKISEKVGLSIDAVRNRVLSLQKRKIITYYGAVIDYGKLGYNQYKLFIYTKNYSNKVNNKLIYFLLNQKNAINLITMIGPWKLEFEVNVRSISELELIIKDIKDSFPDNIKDIDFAIMKNVEIFACKELLLG